MIPALERSVRAAATCSAHRGWETTRPLGTTCRQLAKIRGTPQYRFIVRNGSGHKQQCRCYDKRGALGAALIQVLFSLWLTEAESSIKKRRRSTNRRIRRIDPFLLIAAVVIVGTAALSPWLDSRQGLQQSTALTIMLAAGVLPATYGAFSRAPYRLVSLWGAIVWLTTIGVALTSKILTLGPPFLVASVIILASILRLTLRPARRTTP